MGFSPLGSVLREEMVHLHLETVGGRPERIIQDLGCLQEGQTGIFSTWLNVFTQQICTFVVLSRARNGIGEVMGLSGRELEMDPASLRVIRELGVRKLVQQLEEVKRQVQQVSEM